MHDLRDTFTADMKIVDDERDTAEPELAMWAAVMQYAWLDLNSSDPFLSLKAMKWVDDGASMEREVGSFDWVCLHVGLNAERVRAKFRATWIMKKVAGNAAAAEAIAKIARKKLVPA